MPTTGTGAGNVSSAIGGPSYAPDLVERFVLGTWENNGSSYGTTPLEFTGPEPGYTHSYGRLPSLMELFDKLWSQKLQCKIVRETNRYASEVPDEKKGTTRGGL
jgi:hypothetical protein